MPAVRGPDELDARDAVVEQVVDVAVVGRHRQDAHRGDHGLEYAGPAGATPAGNVDTAKLPPYGPRMARSLLAPPLRSTVDPGSESFQRNRADALEQLAVLDELLDQAAAGGGEKATARLRSRGKLPIRERIALALDPDSPFLEISPLAAYGSDYTAGGGMVVGIGVIAGVECVVMGNDPTVLGGALTPYALKKWARALEIARENRMPYVSFVESAGADLRPGGEGAAGRRRRRTSPRAGGSSTR